jgi:hypothetical protein
VCARERSLRWNREHPELAATRQRAAAKPEVVGARLRRWRKSNPDAVRAQQARAYADGRGAAKTARYRTAKHRAMPAWVDRREVDAFYALAARVSACTGIEHHVDHIEPLQGETLSGLHVPWNLRILPGVINSAKRNRLESGG